MTQQLRLIQGDGTWRLNARTRRIGRRGVARARQVLDRATPPAGLTRKAG